MQYFVAMTQLPLCVTVRLLMVEIEWSTLRNLCKLLWLSLWSCNCSTTLFHSATQHTTQCSMTIADNWNSAWYVCTAEFQLSQQRSHRSVEYPGWAMDRGPSLAAILWEQCMHYFIVMDEFLQNFKYNILCYSTFCNHRAVIWLWITDEPYSNLTVVSNRPCPMFRAGEHYML